MRPIDTSATRKINKDPSQITAAVGVLLLFAGLSILMLLTAPDWGKPDNVFFAGVVGVVGVTLLGPSAFRLVVLRDPVVVISPQGIQDLRVSGEMVPWSAIEAIGESRMAGKTHQKLILRAGTKIKAATLFANLQFLGPAATTGFFVGAPGLAIGREELEAIVEAYFRAHGNAEPARAQP